MDTFTAPASSHEEKKHPKALGWSIIVAIIIVTNLFFNYATSLVYTEPSYENFCPASISNKLYTDKNQCVDNGGSWSEQVVPVEGNISAPKKAEVTGYCNATYTCQKKYDSAHTIYNRNVFIILVSLGVLVLALGMATKISLLSIAFSWSGVLSLVIASMRYWGSAGNVMRVVILGAALALLIWLAIKKFSNK